MPSRSSSEWVHARSRTVQRLDETSECNKHYATPEMSVGSEFRRCVHLPKQRLCISGVVTKNAEMTRRTDRSLRMMFMSWDTTSWPAGWLWRYGLRSANTHHNFKAKPYIKPPITTDIVITGRQ